MTFSSSPTNNGDRDRRAIGATLLLMVGVIAARSLLVPDGLGDWFNVGLIGVFALFARQVGLDRSELGLEREHLGDGLRWGLGAALVVVAFIAIATVIPAASEAFEDDRVDVGVGSLLVKVMVVIPFGTVVPEELAFRGVLLGLLLRVTGTVQAVIWSSVMFGFWHVVTAWNSAGTNAALDGVSSGTGGRLGVVVGTVVATALIGLVFAGLRLWSKSLVAPILAHMATNVTPFTAAWLLAR